MEAKRRLIRRLIEERRSKHPKASGRRGRGAFQPRKPTSKIKR